MAQPKLRHRLSSQDTAFLYFESEEAPMNIGSVAVFQGEISYERFVKNIEDKLHLIPRYRQRVGPPPPHLAPQGFDLHTPAIPVRRAPPASQDQLQELAAHLYQGMLSRDKPLWEIYLL